MKNRLFVSVALILFARHGYAQTQTQAQDPDEARIADVVTASHILANEGILDSFGHVSTRSVKNPDHMFMPRAMAPALVTRADIVEVDISKNCSAVAPNAPRLNGERFIHCRVYAANPELQSVIHSHDLAVIPFGIANVPLEPVVAQAGFLPAETPLFEVRDAYPPDATKRGVQVTNAKLGDALATKLGKNPAVLMARHGETVVGKSVREATVRALYIHIDAKAQFAGMQLNPHITPIDGPELAVNAKENFDSDRPWQNYLSHLHGAEEQHPEQ
ncbi:class II aldolase/adducin family protein [Caballeronia sp. LP006]|uniref:class II aldolase/adducin family protein n=1 Tax=Caballeronia sp. LP006 TaxID=3038552 RepID=UPI00285A21F5|nr:class II aldolase/adducin family protein [Caballeronia sp. LP006]MDR5832533.1 class II aldolase/adducin family protein [Caballeronia sp. LP006]